MSAAGALTPGAIIRRFHGPAPASAVRIGAGTPGEYESLARLHYRASSPATIARVVSAHDEGSGELAGVLVTSRPTLNAAWRESAWPGRFGVGTMRERAERLNAELRTITRVIVDPRFRGMGLASRLVRAYLAHAETACTEAVAAMGTISPFFERAGMRAVPVVAHARTHRLARRLASLGLGCADLLGSLEEEGELARALRVWARGSAATRRIAAGPVREIARSAACALLAPPVAYAHTQGQEDVQG